MNSYCFLFYGMVISKDLISELPYDITQWKDYICEKNNLYPPNIDYKSNSQKFRDYYARRDSVIKSYDVTIEKFGNLKTTGYALAVKDSILTCVEEFTQNIQNLLIDSIWKKNLTKFCKVLDIDDKKLESPSWLIGMYVGKD